MGEKRKERRLGEFGRRKYLALTSAAIGGVAGCIAAPEGNFTPKSCSSASYNESVVKTTPTAKEGAGIKPASNQPRYWEYGGSPILLIGGSEDDNLFQWPEPELIDQLDKLASVGGNYVRNTMSDRDAVQHNDPDVYAFAKTNSGEFDLDVWNETYWNRLERFLSGSANRDIIVSLELWDEWDHYGNRWDFHPWNPDNNVNYTANETTLETSWEPDPLDEPNPLFRTVPSLNNDTVVLPYQRKFVRKITSVSFEFDHVVYIITNEHHGDPAWTDYWAKIVHEEAESSNKDIYVADMRSDATVQPALDHWWFNFADISQHSESSGETQKELIVDSWSKVSDQPVPLNSVKQYGCSEEGAARLWRSIFTGQAAARYHRGPDLTCKWGLGLNPEAQAHIESLRIVAEEVNVFNAEPHQVVEHLISDRSDNEVYMMADPGRVYGLYFPTRGSIKLDVSDVSGDVRVRWLDIESRQWCKTETRSASEIRVETPGARMGFFPFAHWAAIVKPV